MRRLFVRRLHADFRAVGVEQRQHDTHFVTVVWDAQHRDAPAILDEAAGRKVEQQFAAGTPAAWRTASQKPASPPA